MGKPTLPLAGQCRCGRVAIEVMAPPVITMACHCTGCQRMSASAYSLSAGFPAEAFRVTEGEPVIGGLHGETPHFFCGWCMTWMFTRLDPMPFVNVRATMFDDTAWYVPFAETFTSEALPWARLAVARHSYEGFPPVEAYGPLMAEYAARG